MLHRDARDIVVGLVLALLGVGTALYAAERYELGTVVSMGPGMVPTSLGVILAVLGILIAVPAFFREGKVPSLDWRAAVAVLLAVISFAVSIDRLGMIPTVVLMTVVATFANERVRVGETAVLAIALGFGAYLIFGAGLGLHIPAFRW